LYSIDFENLTIYDAGRSGISIEVTIRVLNASHNFEAKIDTGSEACIFSREYGERLGIEIENGQPQRFSTATGTFLTYSHSISLEIAGFEFDSDVFFTHHQDFNRNVLGRRGFLDRMVVGINDYEGKLYLSRYKDE
jgi:hypothetical protein